MADTNQQDRSTENGIRHRIRTRDAIIFGPTVVLALIGFVLGAVLPFVGYSLLAGWHVFGLFVFSGLAWLIAAAGVHFLHSGYRAYTTRGSAE